MKSIILFLYTVVQQINLHPSLTFLDATLMTSVAKALGEYLSLDVATTGNWYSMKYVLFKQTKL